MVNWQNTVRFSCQVVGVPAFRAEDRIRGFHGLLCFRSCPTWGSLPLLKVGSTECLLSDIVENAVSFSYQREKVKITVIVHAEGSWSTEGVIHMFEQTDPECPALVCVKAGRQSNRIPPGSEEVGGAYSGA